MMNDLEHRLTYLHRLSVPDHAGLPLATRVLDRLTEVIILTDELLAEFQTEEANPMLWLEPHIQRVYDDVDSIMRRLAQ